jgi:predicted nucleic acid-binding protein
MFTDISKFIERTRTLAITKFLLHISKRCTYVFDVIYLACAQLINVTFLTCSFG